MRQKPELPTGTITFLFTDIEASTRLIQDLGESISNRVFADHRRQLVEAVESADGSVYQDQGESFVFVFSRAKDAVLAAVAAQSVIVAARTAGDLDASWAEGREMTLEQAIEYALSNDAADA